MAGAAYPQDPVQEIIEVAHAMLAIDQVIQPGLEMADGLEQKLFDAGVTLGMRATLQVLKRRGMLSTGRDE